MKRILAATDGSEDANRAIDFAASLARDLGAELALANVIGGYGLPDEIFKRFTRAEAAWLDELLEAHSAQILKTARERAAKGGASLVAIESRRGDGAPTLVRIADDLDAGAIVVGRRGASGAASLLLGSAAHKLVSLATRPVIVVP